MNKIIDRVLQSMLRLFKHDPIIQHANIRKTRHEEFEISLDLSTQVLELHIPEDKECEFNNWDTSKTDIEAELYPSIKSIKQQRESDFVSVSVLISKAKQFDDGLYAAVEYLCQYGTDRFVSKQKILKGVAEALKTFTNENKVDTESLNFCRSYINAAANLGGQQLSEISEIKTQAQKIKSRFLSNEFRSKPISFYIWTEDLSGIFQQDRMLQKELDAHQIRLLARGLSEEEKMQNAYQAYLSLIKKLTNPFSPEYRDLSQVQNIQKERKYSFFPPSKSPETEYIKRHYQNRSIPEGYNLIDELVQQIQKGGIKLTPNSESGWYDYQLYALEPFLLPETMPEAQRLHFSKTYEEELTNIFKGTIALTRETHIKQLEIPDVGAAMPEPKIYIYPELSVEPIATYYLRRAQSYGFVREILQSTFGEVTLQNVSRLTSSGKVPKPLLTELIEMESLFYGMYEIVANEIGLDIGSQVRSNRNTENKEDIKIARKWIHTLPNDPDVGVDNRMMVPVYYDTERRQIKVWAVLGYAVKPLSISFKSRPTVVAITDQKGKKANAKLEFESTWKELIYPVSAEIYVNKLLNKDEFRVLCDQYKTQSAILKALQNY